MRERCPAATLCLDPYHVVALATAALDEVRREVWQQARRAGDASGARWLKGARWALWKRPERLTERQQAKLATIEHINRRLYRAYLLKEELRLVFHTSPDKAVPLLEAWLVWARRCRIASFVKLAKTITTNKAGITATLTHRLSNARIEAINTTLRPIRRRAYGFHSAEALIALAMLTVGGLRPPLPGRTRRPTETSGAPFFRLHMAGVGHSSRPLDLACRPQPVESSNACSRPTRRRAATHQAAANRSPRTEAELEPADAATRSRYAAQTESPAAPPGRAAACDPDSGTAAPPSAAAARPRPQLVRHDPRREAIGTPLRLTTDADGVRRQRMGPFIPGRILKRVSQASVGVSYPPNGLLRRCDERRGRGWPRRDCGAPESLNTAPPVRSIRRAAA